MSILEKILKGVHELPPFPVVIQRVLQLVDDPRSSAQDVVKVIQYDPSITADVLRLCNSSYFGLGRTVDSLREALVRIGFNQLLEIILSRESVQLYEKACQGYDLDQGALWRHSVACALLSGIVAQRLNREASPATFTAALLHDIGKTVLSQFVRDYFEEVRDLTQKRRLSFVEAEREVLGIDHAELGGRITELWRFPQGIVSPIRYHHTPFLTRENPDAVQLIYLCDTVALMTGIGGGADGLSYRAHGEVMKQYQLKGKDIEQFIVLLEDRFRLVEGILNRR